MECSVLEKSKQRMYSELAFKYVPFSYLPHYICFSRFGTGATVIMITGLDTPVISRSGLLTIPCFQLTRKSPVMFALEGSVAIAGAALTWLKESLGALDTPEEAEVRRRVDVLTDHQSTILTISTKSLIHLVNLLSSISLKSLPFFRLFHLLEMYFVSYTPSFSISLLHIPFEFRHHLSHPTYSDVTELRLRFSRCLLRSSIRRTVCSKMEIWRQGLYRWSDPTLHEGPYCEGAVWVHRISTSWGDFVESLIFIDPSW